MCMYRDESLNPAQLSHRHGHLRVRCVTKVKALLKNRGRGENAGLCSFLAKWAECFLGLWVSLELCLLVAISTAKAAGNIRHWHVPDGG